MKPEFNRRYQTITLYACAVACIIVLVFFYATHFYYVTGALAWIRRVLDPIIVGCIIAYLVNPLVNKLEKHCFSGLIYKTKKPHPRLARNLSISVAYLIIGFFLLLFLWGVLPQIVRAYQELIGKYDIYLANLNDWIRRIIGNSGFLSDQYNKIVTNLQESFSELLSGLIELLAGSYTAIFRFFADFVEQALNLLLGLVISVYLLASKQGLFAQVNKLAVCTIPRRLRYKLGHVLGLTHRMFGGFIIGKIIDSLIIGVITLVTTWILQIPFCPLISVIIAVTNVIPVFGPFIGAIPCAFIIFVIDPPKMLVFVVLIFLIQQLDGNVIGPKILGDQVGISALGVIVSITIMGGLFGVTGMFVGVPTFAVLYTLVKEAVDRKLRAKNLPTNLSAYMKLPEEEVTVVPASVTESEYKNDEDSPSEIANVLSQEGNGVEQEKEKQV